MAKILVTGGAGFVGSNLADELIKQGHKVVVADDLSTGKKEYLNPKAKFYKLDIGAPAVEQVFKREKFDQVFHLAAQIDVRISVADPALDNKINVLGGLNILDNCRKYRVKKIIFASTGGAIYGEAGEIPTTEKYPPGPLSPYGIHKLTFEKYLNYYCKVYGQDYTALRFANIYGPRQYKGGEAGVAAIFSDKAVSQEKCVINGDGRQTRDYVYISDAVRAFITAASVKYQGEINIGLGKEINVLQIVKAIEKALDKRIKAAHGPAKAGEQRRSCLANGLAKKVLNWRPEAELEEGIRKTIEWSKHKDLNF